MPSGEQLSEKMTKSMYRLIHEADFKGNMDLEALEAFVQQARNILVVTEGFPAYGGSAGHDLEAFAQGLEEVLEEDYLKYRIRSVTYVGEKLIQLGVPIFQPPGGHAIYLDAEAFLPHILDRHWPVNFTFTAVSDLARLAVSCSARSILKPALSNPQDGVGTSGHTPPGLYPKPYGLRGGMRRGDF